MSDQPEALRLADALDTALLYGLRALSAAAELRRQHAEIEALKEELETERVRLAACGVVAMANTPETASKCREMRPEYRSASCDDVAKAVDREMALRAALKQAVARQGFTNDELISARALIANATGENK